MSEEILVTESASPEEKIPDFKKVCVRIGITMIVVFVARWIATIMLTMMSPVFDGMNGIAAYALESVISFIFLYVIPISSVVLLLGEKGMMGRMYKKPVYFSNAMGMFPAFYGLAIFTNLLTMLVSLLFKDTDLNDSFNTVNELQADNVASALILLFQLVVIAPIFEEFWYRGVVMEKLKPYGNGFAIFVSALLFGLTHANLQQFFYATTLGVCLGYIAISTKSIVVTTVMHAMFNSISGIMLLFMSVPQIQDYMAALESGEEAEAEGIVIVYLLYMFAVVMLLIVGVLMAIWKLRKIKKYRVPKVWEVSTAKRWGIFLSRVTVIIMLVLAADTLTFRFIPSAIYKLISGS